MAAKAGRPPITAETPLSDREEVYVQAVVRGSTKRKAMELAGYHISRNTSRQGVGAMANRLEKKPNVAARLLALKAQQVGPAPHNPIPPAPPGVDPFDPANITPAWVIRQAQHVFQEALNSEDYGSSLRSLDFIAKFTGLIQRPVGPGRPKSTIKPNQGDMSGNFSDSNDAGADYEAQEHQDAFGFDDGDGTGSPTWDEPFFKKASADPAVKPAVQRDRTNGASTSGAGMAREDGDALFEEVAGE